MMTFVLFCILAGVFAGIFLGNKVSARQPVNGPSAVDIWWKNLKRTPLSDQESKQIAEQIAKLYMQWKSNSFMNHSWLCLGIQADKVSFRQLYSYSGEFKAAPSPSISYSHRISCQNDRELLASYILSAIKSKDPGCMLFLDGDALILPTNSK